MNERSFIVNRHLRATMGSNRSALPQANSAVCHGPAGHAEAERRWVGRRRRSYLTGQPPSRGYGVPSSRWLQKLLKPS